MKDSVGSPFSTNRTPPPLARPPALAISPRVHQIPSCIVVSAAFAPPVHYLSTYNRAQMQDVFLGKGTWAVLCSGGDSGEHTAVSKRFDTAARALKGSVKFGVVDCTGSLPSGKSVLQKFDLAVCFNHGSRKWIVHASSHAFVFLQSSGIWCCFCSTWSMGSDAVSSSTNSPRDSFSSSHHRNASRQRITDNLTSPIPTLPRAPPPPMLNFDRELSVQCHNRRIYIERENTFGLSFLPWSIRFIDHRCMWSTWCQIRSFEKSNIFSKRCSLCCS